jgi:hypothetical protein
LSRRGLLIAGSAFTLAVLSAPAAVAAPELPTPSGSSTDAPAAGELGIQLLDGPASALNDPRAHIYIVDQVKAGTTITRHVRVSNRSAAPADVSLYAAAASISHGQFVFADGRTANDLTSWTSVTPPAPALGPNATAVATVRIAVPKDATKGERYAVVWAQIAKQPTGGGVTEVSRVGVRIYLDVANGPQASSFSIGQLTASRSSAGIPQISARIRNTGQRAVDVSGTVRLSNGPGGLQTQPVKTDQTLTLAPGGSGTVSARFDPQLPAGPWLVSLAMVSGTVKEQASATLTFPGAGHSVTVASNRADGSDGWLWTWLALGGLAVIVAAVAVATWLRRRVRPTRR